MTSNLSFFDRRARFVLACALALLLLFGSLSGSALVAVALVAVILAVTSVAGFCPLYRVIGFSSRTRRDA